MRVSIHDMHGLFNVNNLIQGNKVIIGEQEQSVSNIESNSDEELLDESEKAALESSESIEGGISNDQISGQLEGQSSDPENNDDSGKSKQPSWYSVFQSLLINLELEPELADSLLDWVDADDLPSSAKRASRGSDHCPRHMLPSGTGSRSGTGPADGGDPPHESRRISPESSPIPMRMVLLLDLRDVRRETSPQAELPTRTRQQS